MPMRESFFRCIFSSAGTQLVAHVRAWDAEEAVQLFRVELHADEVAERGSIEVTGLDGVVVQRDSYQPGPQAALGA
jgi:hypothetical protein